MNYGFTKTGAETYEKRQEQLCLEVFRASAIESAHTIVDVGFGSGEQDFLLLRTQDFCRLLGFNIAESQVRYASARAEREGVSSKLSFRVGEAEVLPGVEEETIDRVLAIECAFYFDRTRFYRRASEVLKPGGLLVAADISLSDRLEFLTRRDEGFRRFGTRSSNRMEWEKWFFTQSLRDIRKETRPGAQMTVLKILRFAPFSRETAEARREWLKMAFYTQLIAVGLPTGLVHYDLLVLEKKPAR